MRAYAPNMRGSSREYSGAFREDAQLCIEPLRAPPHRICMGVSGA
jgi:hypothetical protein